MLRDELFAPHGYRIAHIFVNALSFGNPQFRQRYFFVAYKGDRNFNVEPPDLPDYQPTVFDMIGHLRNVETRGANGVLEPDDYTLLKPAYMEALKVLPNGFHLNSLGRCASHLLPSELKEIWDSRTSEIPFSLHCPRRLTWFASSPVLTGSCAKLIHPQQHRPCTLRELSLLMGWHDTCPIGQDQAAQLGKGVCPDVGRWLAQQVNHYLSDAWGSEDWESKYNPSTGIFMGGDCHGAIEKCFDLNSYFVSTVRMVDGVETLPVKLKVRR
jgi:site-specific DNA-cytosine methylase